MVQGQARLAAEQLGVSQGELQAAAARLAEFQQLRRGQHPEHAPGQLVCDRCFQPIQGEMFRRNLDEMALDVADKVGFGSARRIMHARPCGGGGL